MKIRIHHVIVLCLLATCWGLKLSSDSGTGSQAQEAIVVIAPPTAASNSSQLDAIHVYEAHAYAFTGAGQRIAIIDGAVNLEVIDSSRVLVYSDLLSVPSFDDSGHGTAVAAVAMDVARDASFLLYRVIDDQGVVDLQAAAQAIEDAIVDGATVINLSFVTTDDCDDLRHAIALAQSMGVHLVAATGPGDLDGTPYPAAYPEVLGVSSVVVHPSGFTLAAGAYHGDAVDILAQGVEVIVPHGTSPSGLASATGTSFAAPFVAAGIALIRAGNPGYDHQEVELTLLHATQRAALTPAQRSAACCERVLDLEPMSLQ